MNDPSGTATVRPCWIETMTAQSFATVSRVVATEAPDRYAARVDPDWTVGGKPNGGYLLAMLARAALRHSAHEHVVAASAHYLHPPDPGPVELNVEALRAGRTASQLRARMTQDGRPCVEALLTTATVGADTPVHWVGGVPVVPDTRRADAVRATSAGPSGLLVSIMDQIDLRLDRASTGFAVGRPSGRGELWGWLELSEAESFDPVSLLFAVDAFPPAPLDVLATGWVPTLELTVYVRALPAPGPVRILQRAHLIDDQRVDEICWVWDSTGRVVAHGTQLAGIRVR